MPIAPELLRSVGIFQLLDDDELAELAPHIDQERYAAGQVIFKQGDAGGAMHIVLAGMVKTITRAPTGAEIELDELRAGEIFGELSLLDGRARSATATALEPTQTAVVDQDDLNLLFARKPAAALDILKVVGQRIRKTDDVLHSLVAKNANVEIEDSLSLSDRVSDAVARFGGSWSFVLSFLGMMLVWIVVNTWLVMHPFDPPPYIGLNLILSMIAALQAPVIMMSQNRQDAKDRVRSELDYRVNVKAELEIMELHAKLEELRNELRPAPPPAKVA